MISSAGFVTNRSLPVRQRRLNEFLAGRVATLHWRSLLFYSLSPFLAGKGTIRFPASRPIPLDLVRRIVEVRVAEVDEVEGGPERVRGPDGDHEPPRPAR